jgi:CRP/FNR family transcriptional regulator
VQLSQGEYFVREGEVCPQFAVLISGSLRVFKVGETGREITLYHVCAGQTCMANMLCTLLGTPSPATAVTEEPVEASSC